MKQEASDLESYLDELKQFEVRRIFFVFFIPFSSIHTYNAHTKSNLNVQHAQYLADKYTGDKMSRSERTDKAARRVGLSLPKSASDAE